MDVNRSIQLLDLPNEVLENIVDHLPFVAVRQNLRLTCKRLNDLCNSERFCRQEMETIVWSKRSENHIVSSFCRSTRGCFHLSLVDVTLNHQQVSAFFEQHGAKVRSLSFTECQSPPAPGLFEFIIMHCEALCSLSIRILPTYTFSFDSIITRPTVTSLELLLDSTFQSPDIFPRILPVFPNVKHLYITAVQDLTCDPESVILDFVVNFNHLETLRLDINLVKPLSQAQKFLDYLPKLKKLFLSFAGGFQESSNFWRTFASRLNTSSIILDRLDTARSNDIISLLSVTDLKNLTICSAHAMYLNIEFFKALVSSQLKTIDLDANFVFVSDIPADLQIEANKTVTDMNLDLTWRNNYGFNEALPIMLLFPTYFHGLIHLEMGRVNDLILHRIFKYQKNLRSLVLHGCGDCSVAGFCGTVETQFENSITNLQKLENLLLTGVDAAVIQSESFQTAFNFPRLKYLKILVNISGANMPNLQKPEIQMNTFKSCVNLEALCLPQFAAPSSEILLSLHQNLKHLNYLSISEYPTRTYVNLKHFYWVDLRKLGLDRYPELYYYDAILDRTVFSDIPFSCRPLYLPEISSHTVDWIILNHDVFLNGNFAF